MKPIVSVIIPHRNDSCRLAQCIDALTNQTYPRNAYEIIVVDNYSDNIHKQKLRNINNDYNIVLLNQPKLGSYAARNLGLKHSKGSFIAFTDSDCIPEADWIENCLNAFSKIDNCGFIGGRINLFFKEENNPCSLELFDKLFSLNQEKYIKEKQFGATANLFTSEEVINKVGSFNEKLFSGGDKEWCLRVKKKLYNIDYCDKAIVRHPARSSFKSMTKKKLRICGGKFIQQKEQGISSIKLFFSNIRDITPPVVTIYRLYKNKHFKKIKSSKKKLEIIMLLIYIRYLNVLETFKLLSGYEPKNL